MISNIAKTQPLYYAVNYQQFIQNYHLDMNNPIKDVLNIGQNCYERFIEYEVLADLKNLDITLAGCSNLSGKYTVSRFAPLEHTLFYTLKGQGKLTTLHGEFFLRPNSLVILPSKQSFRVAINSDHWDIIWLNLANTKRWQHFNLEQAQVLEDQNLTSLHLALELLYSEPNAKLREGAIPVLTHYLNGILRVLPDKPLDHRLDELFQDIDKRLQFNWTIAAMCQQVHYSAPHLHRLCQSQFGKSPIQKLIQMRIERAKNLLLSTSWSIQHIANYVGYSNVFNFSKSFKKYQGVSPSEYRINNK